MSEGSEQCSRGGAENAEEESMRAVGLRKAETIFDRFANRGTTFSISLLSAPPREPIPAMSNPQQLVQKLWNYCSILRDDGLSYGDYPSAWLRVLSS
jgi:hypothetical protein